MVSLKDTYSIEAAKTLRLTQNQVALVDDLDFIGLEAVKWHAAKRGDHYYAFRQDGELYYNLADFLMGVPPVGYTRDHIDGNTLNYQRRNLRLATKTQNGANRGAQSNSRSGYKGVFAVNKGQFRAQIKSGSDRISLGRFPTPEEAAKAYDMVAIRLFGEFAVLNFPLNKNSTQSKQ